MAGKGYDMMGMISFEPGSSFRLRPSMYLGSKDIRRLLLYMLGWEEAEDRYNVSEDQRQVLLSTDENYRFAKWVHSTIFQIDHSNVNPAAAMAEWEHPDDPAAAFDLWFEWYDQWKAADSEAADDRQDK